MRTREEILKEIRMLLVDVEVAVLGFNRGIYDTETLWMIEADKANAIKYLLWVIGLVKIDEWILQSDVFKMARLALLDDANISNSNV